ncbi:MAG: transcriptional repressor LexA [Bacillota bacterium]|nr:transcriptional repressor LexA [Bacillota bacterium]
MDRDIKALGDRLRELRKQRDLTQVELAKALQVSRGAVSMWELNQRSPDPSDLKKMADFFGISVDSLLGRSRVPDTFPFRPIPTGPMVQVPIIGVIRAGEPLLAAQNIEGYSWISADEVQGGEYFYLRVTGDSMIGARIQEGDLVLVRQQDVVEDGEIAVVLVNDEEATLKRVYREDGKWLLQAENIKMRPIVLDKRDVRIIGKVVKVEFRP